MVAALSQSIKILIDLFSGKKFNRYTLISSGGMPSTHSTITSSALMMVILFE
jgi:acid phosphatase family membrane protein YuiD